MAQRAGAGRSAWRRYGQVGPVRFFGGFFYAGVTQHLRCAAHYTPGAGAGSGAEVAPLALRTPCLTQLSPLQYQ